MYGEIRRTVLHALGATGGVALAGCLGENNPNIAAADGTGLESIEVTAEVEPGVTVDFMIYDDGL